MRRAQTPADDACPFGINSHLSPHVVSAFTDVGVRWHRIDVDWDRIEREPGHDDWHDLDALCAEADRRGALLLGSIAYTPAWASGSPDRAAPPRDPAAFAAFAARVARRYRGRIAALSVGNEPNLRPFWRGTRTQYLDLLVLGLGAIREAAPDVLRCGPDLSSFRDHDGRRWLDAALSATDDDPDGPLLDVVTHHQYGARDRPDRRAREIDELHAWLERRPIAGRPLWVTEIGWDTGKVPDEVVRASHLRAVMAAMAERAGWWRRTFWYDSHGLVDGRGPARWGLLVGPEDDPRFGEPLGAYHAYADVVREHGADPVHPASGDVDRVVRAAYRGLLGREPDPEGAEAYAAVIRSHGVAAMCRALLGSDELAQRELDGPGLVDQLYRGIHGRAPSPAARAHAIREIEAGRGAARVAAMLEGAEFAAGRIDARHA